MNGREKPMERHGTNAIVIAGEVGDLIRHEASTARLRVVAADVAADTLTLEAPFTWAADQGVVSPLPVGCPRPGGTAGGAVGGPRPVRAAHAVRTYGVTVE